MKTRTHYYGYISSLHCTLSVLLLVAGLGRSLVIFKSSARQPQFHKPSDGCPATWLTACSAHSTGAHADYPPEEAVSLGREIWGPGTARAGKRKASTKRGGGHDRRPRGRGDRGPPAPILWWRLYNVEVPVSLDPGKDIWGVTDEVVAAVCAKLGLPTDEDKVVESDVVVVRKSFDARTKKGDLEPRFSYTVDVQLEGKVVKSLRLRPKEGKIEPSPAGARKLPVFSSIGGVVTRGKARYPASIPNPTAISTGDIDLGSGAVSMGDSGLLSESAGISSTHASTVPSGTGPKVVIVGAGPAGLFAALELVDAGLKPIIVERGMPVERRGREIGALFSRRVLNPESNLCYGEGGAGTWSDGKLTTRIGRNTDNVRKVLETLVEHGAPDRILVDGKPHLGTDRLVRILRDLRAFLTESGARFLFDTRVEGFLTRGGGAKGSIRGLKLAGGGELLADKVILSVGHSARAVYERLLDAGVGLEAKGIAVGFRIEHPQALIDDIRYGPELASMVNRGKGKVPVADYRLTQSLPDLPRIGETSARETGDDLRNSGSRKVATQGRSCYSFCMCPGGQVVPTSVDPKEVCVNGMSFSKRDSRWANAALVVSLTAEDVAADMASLHGEGNAVGPLRGVRWQSTMERRAAIMGGGDLVVPVQRVTDFMVGASSREASLPSSSYRLGVRAGPLHELYPAHVTEGLQQALEAFEERMPGFVCDEALLHGVETRTSAPVQVERDSSTLECPSMEGLFPAGEGAGYAGGIVSAAVDGIRVGEAVVAQVAQSMGNADDHGPN